ncbi:MAG TPA: copper resistance protein CopC [Pyrinomonadaceae bacterium]|nr:copper resistance protein CopC [Pyrinomonadaceae bacterium]
MPIFDWSLPYGNWQSIIGLARPIVATRDNTYGVFSAMNHSVILRVSLLLLGAVILTCWVFYHLVPRASFVTSNPHPGAVLATPPETVSINFSDELAANSEISVASTITLGPSGESLYGDGKTFTSAGLDHHDPQHKTLTVNLDPGLPKGLYWVKWKTSAARGGAQRYGNFCFSAGMPIPASITRAEPGGFREENPRFRDYRAVLLGGLFLLAFAVALPYISWRR